MNSTYRERIEEVLYDYWAKHRDCKNGCQHQYKGEESIESILALIQEVSKSAKPEKKQYYRCFNPECVSTMPVEKQAFNEAIDQYEQNIKELLGGSSE